jgi:hypothetical protein
MNRQAEADIRRKTKVLEHAKRSGNVSHTCSKIGVSRDSFYRFKEQPEKGDPEAPVNSKPCLENSKLRVPKDAEEKFLHVRREFGLGQLRISWFLQRYYDIKVSPNGVFGVAKRNGVSRLPAGASTRSPGKCKRKNVLGYQVQIDVKFLFLRDRAVRRIRRYQYTAVDDATHIRALKVYQNRAQANAIDFLDYVVLRFPFLIRCGHTHKGHKFQSMRHWHAEDCGNLHRDSRLARPHLNGKVGHSQLTDKQEFYQLLSYTGNRISSEACGMGNFLQLPSTAYCFGRENTV